MNEYLLIKNAGIFTPTVEHKNHYLIIGDRRISKMGKMSDLGSESRSFNTVLDLKNRFHVCPGFIDIHTHGAIGIDLTVNPERLNEVSAFKAQQGVTMYLPTFLSELRGLEEHVRQIKAIVSLMHKRSEYAIPMGINLETPYLSPDCGMQKGEYNLPPTKENNEALIRAAEGFLRIITIAPELAGALDAINFFSMSGIITGIGHSLAGVDVIEKAINNGATLATHLYNGTYQLAARELGVIPVSLNEYLAVREDVWAEAICDSNGAHIDPNLMKLLLKAKGFNKLILITDNLFCAGLPDEEVVLPDGRTIYRDHDVYRLKDRHLGGSGFRLNEAVRHLRKHTGLELLHCLKTVTKNPAELLHMQNRVGEIRTGLDANITVIDDDVNVYMTIVEGKIVYDNLERIKDTDGVGNHE